MEPDRRRTAVRQAPPRPGAPEGTRQLAGWSEPPIRDEDRLWNIVDVLVEIGDSAWRFGRAGGARLAARPARRSRSLVIGGRTEAQFKDNIAAASLKLTSDERARLDAVSRRRCSTPIGTSSSRQKTGFGPADLVLDREDI